MSENLNRGTRDFSKYDTMATADLEEILRLDAELPEGAESDTDLLIYVMGVLADRRRNNTSAGKTALEAWRSFEENYIPAEEDPAEDQDKRAGVRVVPWLRRAVAAAAVVALLVSLPFTAKAFGLNDLWDVFARWAKETFSFVSSDDIQITEPDPENHEQYTSLQDALVKSNRDPSIVPSWIPDGYVFDSVTKEITPAREAYIAFYTNGSNAFRIIVQSYLDTDPEKAEINNGHVEIYHSGDMDFYFFENMDERKAVWITDAYECSISGDVSFDEIKSMIDSIGKE